MRSRGVEVVHRPLRADTKILGFEVRMEVPGRAAFLRSPESVNDHDLGLFEVGAGHADGRPKVGPYHLDWDRTLSRRAPDQKTGAAANSAT